MRVILTFWVLSLTVGFKSFAQTNTLARNLLDSFSNANTENYGYSMFFSKTDVPSITQLAGKNFEKHFDAFAVYRCKFHLTMGHHHHYEWCLVLANTNNEILHVQKPFFWSGPNKKFWETLESTSVSKDNALEAFKTVLDLFLELENAHLDSTNVVTKRLYRDGGRQLIYEAPIVSETYIVSRFYKRQIDEASSSGYSFHISFALTANIEDRLKFKLTTI